jgi:hypothetical protein
VKIFSGSQGVRTLDFWKIITVLYCFRYQAGTVIKSRGECCGFVAPVA